MPTTAAVLLLALLLAIAWTVKYGGRLPRMYRSRSCQGKLWKQAFPEATKDEVRTFLSCFVAAFAFAESERLKLQPEDQVLQIYRALYPSKWLADALELETLALGLKRHYGLELSTIWRDDLTLGEVFAQARSAGTLAH
jgi:propanediol dehydratase small subunit